MTDVPQVVKLTSDEIELDALPGMIVLPDLLLFTRECVRDIAEKTGIPLDSVELLHTVAVAGFDAVCDLQDRLEECQPDDPARFPRWNAFMNALGHIGYLLHNGRTHDGKTIRFV